MIIGFLCGHLSSVYLQWTTVKTGKPPVFWGLACFIVFQLKR